MIITDTNNNNSLYQDGEKNTESYLQYIFYRRNSGNIYIN